MIALETAAALPAVKSPVRLQHRVARHGELRLGFAKNGQQTIMNHSFFRAPLQVMRAINDRAGCACVYMLSPTGGVVQGDRNHIQVTVEQDAHALVTTLAATKVYRMPHDNAIQQIIIEVMPNATLEFVPDAAILFEDADFKQTIDVYLHEGALMIIQDGIMPGRLASGESLSFRRFQNRLTVYDCRGLLLHEVQEVIPQTGDLDRMGVLEGYRCWASWYLLGDLDRLGMDSATFCEQQDAELQAEDGILGSASRLYRNGLNVRLLTPYWSPMAAQLERMRKRVRTEYMHLPAPDLRK